MSLNTAFKCPKSITKTLGKSVKYVQGEIIRRKMSGGIPWGEIFRERSYCPERNYLRKSESNCLGQTS